MPLIERIVVMVVIVVPTLVSTEKCHLCPNGFDAEEFLHGEVLRLPLGLDGRITTATCRVLNATVASQFQSVDEECVRIQSISSLCGCRVRADACSVISPGSSDTRRRHSGELVVQYLPGAPWLGPTTCDYAEAYLSSLSDSDSECRESKRRIREQCRFFETDELESKDARSERSLTNARSRQLQNETSESSSPINVNETTQETCTLCPSGGTVGSPHIDVGFMLPTIVRDGLPDTVPTTCGTMEAIAGATIRSNSSQCDEIQQLAFPCGCPPPAGSCKLCPNDMAIPLPNKTIPTADFGAMRDVFNGQEITCEFLANSITELAEDDSVCWFGSQLEYICGCNEGVRSYLGADTEAKRLAMVWVPRVSAILSVIASSLIIVYLIRNRDESSQKFYRGLILAMSTGDVIGSTAMAFTTLPIPEYLHGVPAGIPGASGNGATCTAQGFFIQLGYMGMFYNMTLSFYYLMVIRFNYREAQLQRLKLCFHLPSITVALALALAGIPFYREVIWACHIAPPPLAETYAQITCLVIVPISIVILGSTLNMIFVYATVRRTRIEGERWNLSLRASGEVDTVMSGGRRSSRVQRSAAAERERTVFWQGILYLAAFYVTWPPFLLSVSIGEFENYWLHLISMGLLPLQGLWNSLVFFRVRFCSRSKQLRSRRRGSSPARTASCLFPLWSCQRSSQVDRDRSSQQDSVAVPEGPTGLAVGAPTTVPSSERSAPKEEHSVHFEGDEIIEACTC